MRRAFQAAYVATLLLPGAALIALYLGVQAVSGSLFGGYAIGFGLLGYGLLVWYLSRRGPQSWPIWPWSLISPDFAAVAKALRSQRLAARGRYIEAAALADSGAAQARDTWARAVCGQAAAIALLDAGDLAGVEARLDSVDAGFRAIGDAGGELTSINTRGAMFSRLRRLDDAAACFEHVLVQTQSDRRRRRLAAAAHYNLGWVAYQRGRWEDAYRWWWGAPSAGGPEMKAWLRLGFARLALQAGAVHEVRTQLPERGPWRHRVKPAATRLMILATADFREGRYADARQKAARALALDSSADRQRLEDLLDIYRQAAAAGLEDAGWWLSAAQRLAEEIGVELIDVGKP